MADKKLSTDTWLNLQIRKIDKLADAEASAKKKRQKIELILLVACLMMVIYTYPVHNLENNPAIEISFISVTVLLRDAIAVFPTIIASFYLVFLYSAGRHWALLFSINTLENDLNEFQETGKIDTSAPRDHPRWRWRDIPLHLLLPSIMLSDIPDSPHLSGISGGIVNLIVGTIFTLFPYASAIFITIRAWELLNWKYLLVWDVACVLIMGLTWFSTLTGVVIVIRSTPPTT